VRVFKGEDEVTGSCSILFTDEKKQGIGYSLDDSGWVFATLPRGPRHLSFVNCAVWNGLFYGTDALRFDVAGGGRTTYFGDVSFYLADEDGKAFWRAVGLGIAGVPVASLAGSLASSGSQLIVTTGVINPCAVPAYAKRSRCSFPRRPEQLRPRPRDTLTQVRLRRAERHRRDPSPSPRTSTNASLPSSHGAGG
jgi:hypothetical protein